MSESTQAQERAAFEAWFEANHREYGMGHAEHGDAAWAAWVARAAVSSGRARMSDTKRAPVQGYAPGIPWELHLEAYAVYSKRYGPQPALIDLEGRNCRGGFHVDELDAFVPDWRDRAAADQGGRDA